MRHLFNTTVEILESITDVVDGARVQTWQKSALMFDPTCALGEMKCRLDLIFLRVGKDTPAPIVAGRTPDRTGVMYCSYTANLQGGQIIKCITGPYTGSSFLLKLRPDVAQDFSRSHHIEVQVFEVNQAGYSYPSGAPS
jgi:hypothetical protein